MQANSSYGISTYNDVSNMEVIKMAKEVDELRPRIEDVLKKAFMLQVDIFRLSQKIDDEELQVAYDLQKKVVKILGDVFEQT